MTHRPNPIKGWHYALACFLIWGLFPLYWFPLNQSGMPAEQLLAQRVVWSSIFALIFLTFFKQWPIFWQVWSHPKSCKIFVLSSLLIAMNWLIYLWAIVHHRVLDASLGYGINPLFNILLGRIFLKEKLNHLQILAIIFATLGILWLAIPVGQIPWVALLLAGSFGFYALLRKLFPVGALAGLAVETVMMLPFAIIYLIWCYLNGQWFWSELNTLQTSLLIGSGVITIIPLLLFASAAQRMSLSLLGILQYISPTLQFFLGWILFQESLNMQQLMGYILVWIGVGIFLFSLNKKAA